MKQALLRRAGSSLKARAPISRALSTVSDGPRPRPGSVFAKHQQAPTAPQSGGAAMKSAQPVFASGQEAAKWLLRAAIRPDDSHQRDFVEAVETLVPTLVPVFDRRPEYALVMRQLLEPEKCFEFRVPWTDDEGYSRVNRGYRVQYSSALGPYSGATYFNKQLTHSQVKAMAFDNIFSNALCGGVGAAAGGADFDPRNKSEAEIMRFCQSYMTAIVANVGVGPKTDMPGVGIGVGEREVAYLYGQYKRITSEFTRARTGVMWGGELAFPEATGYGVAHFARHVLEMRAAAAADEEEADRQAMKANERTRRGPARGAPMGVRTGMGRARSTPRHAPLESEDKDGEQEEGLGQEQERASLSAEAAAAGGKGGSGESKRQASVQQTSRKGYSYKLPSGSSAVTLGNSTSDPSSSATMVAQKKKSLPLRGLRCLVTGTGNVALNVCEKLLHYGAVPLTLSDSHGYVYQPEGFRERQISELKRLQLDARWGNKGKHGSPGLESWGRISLTPSNTTSAHIPGSHQRGVWRGGGLRLTETAQFGQHSEIWDVPCDYVFPCAVQNELDEEAARRLIAGGCKGVFEGASAPCTQGAIGAFKESKVLFVPNKLVNAGGVAVNSVNVEALVLTHGVQDVEDLTHGQFDEAVSVFMKRLLGRALSAAEQYGMKGDLMAGANIYGFLRVANAMVKQGAV